MSEKLRILVDCSELSSRNHGGVRSYTIGIVTSILKDSSLEAFILFSSENFEALRENLPMENSIQFLVVGKKSLFEKTVLKFLALINFRRAYVAIKSRKILPITNQHRIQAIYTPTTYINYAVKDLKSIVSVHDIQEKDMPKNFSFRERLTRNFRMKITLTKSDYVHISSEFIQETLFKHYPKLCEKPKFLVVNEGVNLDKFRPGSTSKDRQIIFPARNWPHKNHRTFIDAIRMADIQPEPKYILTGITQKEFSLMNPVDSPSVEVLGVVSDSDLIQLYQKSFAVLSCSLYESSSLPLLEGIACSAIPIASNIDAHREMANNLTMVLFDPLDPKSLAVEIEKLFHSFDSNTIDYRINESNIEKYSWEKVSNSIVSVFRE